MTAMNSRAGGIRRTPNEGMAQNKPLRQTRNFATAGNLERFLDLLDGCVFVRRRIKNSEGHISIAEPKTATQSQSAILNFV